MVSPHVWAQHAASGVALDAAGLIALAELKIILRRTAISGTATFVDALVLCPGIHGQQDATSLNGGEYPMTANITTNYVFRVENQATVAYLQSVGKTGHLTSLLVSPVLQPNLRFQRIVQLIGPPSAQATYFATVITTISAFSFVVVIKDYWTMGIFLMLIVARLLNVVIIHGRRDANWHGTKESGQDRWISMRGYVDDLKAVTSGQWLRELNTAESLMEGLAIVLVYLSAALASNGTQVGKVVILVLFMANAGLLTTSNGLIKSLYMKDRVVSLSGLRKPYSRRLDLAHELLHRAPEKDWALKLGLVNSVDGFLDLERSEKTVSAVQT
ncbi:MAG: hypothetical protein Q9162_001375 [Coniocarpon cinnabarinum]